MKIRATRDEPGRWSLWDAETGKRIGKMQWKGDDGWVSRNMRGLLVVTGESDLKSAIRKHQAIVNRGTRVAR